MVQVRAHQPINTDGSINLEAWLDHAVSVDPALDREALKAACEFARESEQQDNAAKNLWAEGTSSFRTGLEIAEILADLKLDQDSLIAAVLYRGVQHRHGRIKPNPNRWSAHLFLHWVDRDGPHAAQAFDVMAAPPASDGGKVDFDL